MATSHAGGAPIVVTGASGFIGAALVKSLLHDGEALRLPVRRAVAVESARADVIVTGDIGSATDWSRTVDGASTVFHIAGLAHVADAGPGGHAAFFRVNAGGTESLARAAARAGVARFVLISSLGVNGTCSGDRPFTAGDTPAPSNAYARSKHEAELRLREIAEAGGMEWVVVRPPLVYGAAAPGNFGRLARLIATGLPLPFGRAAARRSFVGIDNLVSALRLLSRHPAAANAVHLVRDAEQVTVRELVEEIGRILGRRPALLPIPPSAMKMALSLAGRAAEFERLFTPLEIDMSSLVDDIGWVPPVTLSQGLAAALSRPQHSATHMPR